VSNENCPEITPEQTEPADLVEAVKAVLEEESKIVTEQECELVRETKSKLVVSLHETSKQLNCLVEEPLEATPKSRVSEVVQYEAAESVSDFQDTELMTQESESTVAQ
jgi:hypothetical protein